MEVPPRDDLCSQHVSQGAAETLSAASHRPPCTLTIGFPVRVIATSCIRLRCMVGNDRAPRGRVNALSVLEQTGRAVPGRDILVATSFDFRYNHIGSSKLSLWGGDITTSRTRRRSIRKSTDDFCMSWRYSDGERSSIAPDILRACSSGVKRNIYSYATHKIRSTESICLSDCRPTQRDTRSPAWPTPSRFPTS